MGVAIHTSAKLLHEHAEVGRLSGSKVPSCHKDSQLVPESFALESAVGLDMLMCKIQITSSLEVLPSQHSHRLESAHIVLLIQIVARTLRKRIHEDADQQGWQRRDTHHPSPLGIGAKNIQVLAGERDNVAQHDAKSSKGLPKHREGTTDGSRGTFSRVDGCRSRFGANSETENETASNEDNPVIGSSLPESCNQSNEA